MGEEAGRIEVSGLTRRFGRVTAVDGLSFTVEPGHVTGFLGPTGVGQTTTLRMMVGLATPDAGTATISGSRYRAAPSPGRLAGLVLDAAAFHPGRSGRDHLRVSCTAAGYPRSRADEMLELAGLAEAGRRRPRGAHPGRAGQRPGPPGDRLAQKLAAGLRETRPDSAVRQPCAPRGRAARGARGDREPRGAVAGQGGGR
jgi:ABC-2 type transport system ATP-binding protein